MVSTVQGGRSGARADLVAATARDREEWNHLSRNIENRTRIEE
jgi:hypothetical protein